MTDLYSNPVFYGIQDVAMADGRAARIMYPTLENFVFDAPRLNGTYPLVVFVHGSRTNDRSLCPPDDSLDYKRWTSVLYLLAQRGFIVVSPDVHDVLREPEAAAAVIEDTVRWMQHSWEGKDVLHRPSVFVDPDEYRSRSTASQGDNPLPLFGLGAGKAVDTDYPAAMATPVGIICHSWGARAGAITAARSNTPVDAYVSIAGAFDDNATVAALQKIRPSLLIAGTHDEQNLSYLPPLWHQMPAPKSQVMIARVGHWDWFYYRSGIYYCDVEQERPLCPYVWDLLDDLLTNFMAKHLLNYWTVHPSLQRGGGFRASDVCAVKVRWEDPLSDPPAGEWEGGFDWPADFPTW